MIKISKEDIISFLKANRSTLKDKYGVESIGLIGSYARDEQTEESDIDFIVDFDEISYSKLAGLAIFLEAEFSIKVDIIRKRDNMRRSLLERSKKEAIYA